MIALVGFMAAGKSTVGRLLAARLGRTFIDTDTTVEARAGRSIAQIFSDEGESRFRELEREVVLDALRGPDAVVALGGGAVIDPEIRALLAETHTIYLGVTPEEVLQRIGTGASRPLFSVRDAESLLAERRPLYESVAHLTVETGGREAIEVVNEIVESLSPLEPGQPRRVRVGLGTRSYTVIVGAGIAGDDSLLPDLDDAEKAFLVTHRGLVEMAAPLVSALNRRGLRVETLFVPEGEEGKSLEVTAGLYRGLEAADAHRHDLVVTFGGGVVSDVGGFAGSTYARGMELVHVPTTLLAQVDAAVGGKTGINLQHGKNLVGTIYQPAAVVCDVTLLATCAVEEIRSGMAEVIKYGLIVDPDLLELVVRCRSDIERRDPQVLIDIVARCVAIKSSIVSSDERETGERAFLNYGHTFAHGIEAALGFTGIRHGEAVAIGMMAAALTARELGRIDDDVVELHRTTLRSACLPVGAVVDLPRLEQAWKHDKKYRGGVRFVLLMGLGRPEAGVQVPRAVLEKVVADLADEVDAIAEPIASEEGAK